MTSNDNTEKLNGDASSRAKIVGRNFHSLIFSCYNHIGRHWPSIPTMAWTTPCIRGLGQEIKPSPFARKKEEGDQTVWRQPEHFHFILTSSFYTWQLENQTILEPNEALEPVDSGATII